MEAYVLPSQGNLANDPMYENRSDGEGSERQPLNGSQDEQGVMED